MLQVLQKRGFEDLFWKGTKLNVLYLYCWSMLPTLGCRMVVD